VRIEYDFLRVGSFVEPRRGHIYIDIGNQSLPGVIDTHGDSLESDSFACSSSLIAARPALVTEWITGDDMGQPIRLVMHENPDYDCIASSFLVCKLLEARSKGPGLPEGWDQWAPVIAESARRIDRGETRLRLPVDAGDVPLTPYLSVIALHDEIRRQAPTPKQAWSQMIQQGQDILGRALIVARDRKIGDLNLVDLRGSLSDLGELEAVIEAKIRAFAKDAARIGLDSGVAAGGELDGVFELDLPWREQTTGSGQARIASILDPESGAGFFKSVMRGAYNDYIHATAIFLTVPADPAAGIAQWVRPVISIDPDSRFDLRGLGRRLDAIETEERLKRGIPRVGRPRPGFDNSDPWYDGRGFAFTIVDAPRWGTVLPPRQVLDEVRKSTEWTKARISEIVDASLESIRKSADAAARQKAFGAIVQAIESWSRDTAASRTQIYRECVDAVVALATRADAESYERLMALAPDVLLGLTRNDDPAVRVDALVAAARERHRLERYADGCGRRDVRRLLEIAAGDQPKLLVPQITEEGLAGGEELLLDAVTARFRSGRMPEEPVLNAAISLASRLRDMPRARASIVCLADAIRGTAPESAAVLESIAQETAGSAAGTDVSVPATFAGVRNLIEKDPIRAARGLTRLLGGAVEPEQRPAILQIAGELLDRAAEETSDSALAASIDALVGKMRSVCSAAELLGKVSEAGARSAARVSPAFIGILLHASTSSAAARWMLVAAALEGGWADALAEAHCFVLTPADARLYGDAKLLTSAASGYFSGAPAPAVGGTSRLAFLLLAASRARGLAPTAEEYDLLSKVAAIENPPPPEKLRHLLARTAAASDASLTPAERREIRQRFLAGAADNIRRVRGLVSDQLRHTAPDHFLLADAEPSLAKTEMFARFLTLAGSQEASPAGLAVTLLLDFAVRLPKLNWEIFDELQQHRKSYRSREWGELEDLAQSSFACAVAIESIRRDGVFVTDPDRVRATAASIAGSAAALTDTPLARAVATALRDIAGMLDAYAGMLEETARQDDDLEALSLRMLQASTLSRFVTDWPALQAAGSADTAVRVAARLAGAADTPAVRHAYSRLRGDLGGREDVQKKYGRVEKTLVRIAAPDAGTTVDAWYGRMRDVLSLPAEAIDTAYARLVDVLISRYDIRRARHRIHEYSFEPPSRPLRICMSGWTVVVPLLYLVLFIAAGTSVSAAWWAGGVIDVLTVVLGIVSLGAAVMEWKHKRRSVRKHDSVESLRYKLFLPHYVVPVLIGVYTATIRDEITLHMALQLDDVRYILLAVGFFAAATWALAELIRRHGGRAAPHNVVVAAGRLFAYGFAIALTFNLLLEPLVKFEKDLHDRRQTWIAGEPVAAHDWIVPTDIADTPVLHMTLFPRHIVLDALFGMFIAIVLKGFWKMDHSE